MVRQSITGYAIFNANKMLRQQQDERVVIVMESDADLSIVDGHIQQAAYRLAPGHGKSATLEAARLHREAGDNWAVSVVDKDFEQETDLEGSNVFCTTLYDLDAEIFFTCRELFRRFVRTHCGADGRSSEDLFNEVVDIATAVGVLRHVVIDQQLQLSMARFPVSQLHNDSHGSTFISRALTVSIGRGALTTADAERLRAESVALYANVSIPDEYCNGHDLMSAAALVLSSAGPLNPRAAEFAASFRAAVNCSCFQQLSVYAKVLDWATKQGYANPWDCGDLKAS